MKKTLIIFVVLLSMLWSVGAWAQLKDGLWEMTTQVQIKGLPQKIPPTVTRQCITKSDPVPKAKNQDSGYECKTRQSKISGDTVTYEVECTMKEGTVLTSGKTTYKANVMEGATTTIVKMKGQPDRKMASKLKGKYIGPCPK